MSYTVVLSEISSLGFNMQGTLVAAFKGAWQFFGQVSFSRGRKSFVEIDAGDRGTVPNGWIHKMVRLGGGTARFGGSHLIHWDATLGQSNLSRGLRLIAGQHPTWKRGVRWTERQVCGGNFVLVVRLILGVQLVLPNAI